MSMSRFSTTEGAEYRARAPGKTNTALMLMQARIHAGAIIRKLCNPRKDYVYQISVDKVNVTPAYAEQCIKNHVKKKYTDIFR